MDMVRFLAPEFMALVFNLRMLDPPEGDETSDRLDEAVGYLEKFLPVLQKFDLFFSAALAWRIIEEKATYRNDWTLFDNKIWELLDRVDDELRVRKIFLVDGANGDYFDNYSARFTIDAFNAFPDAVEDIEEAGKCFALQRFTASVFHLMRAMEIAVRLCADRIGATVVDKHGNFLKWGVIVANIGGKIDEMPQGDEKNRWQECHSFCTGSMFHGVTLLCIPRKPINKFKQKMF